MSQLVQKRCHHANLWLLFFLTFCGLLELRILLNPAGDSTASAPAQSGESDWISLRNKFEAFRIEVRTVCSSCPESNANSTGGRISWSLIQDVSPDSVASFNTSLDQSELRIRSHAQKESDDSNQAVPQESSEDYHISACIVNRVFREDKFKITAYECKQWIEYMLYAGVQHIFWYDTARSDDESQEENLKSYINSGTLTYHRFHHVLPGNEGAGYPFEQDNSYLHFLENYRGWTKWLVVMDVDEYPFSPSDLMPGFLSRLVRKFEEEQMDVSQLLLQCMIYQGNPQGDVVHKGWVIEKYQRRRHTVERWDTPGSQGRHKPIFQVKNCRKGVPVNNPHLFPMLTGRTLVIPAHVMRMNHYWGARVTDFGPDTPEVLRLSKYDNSIRPIVVELKNRALSLQSM